MTDAGYTLTETLAALLVIGMAFGGLALGAQVIGSSQLATSQTAAQLQTVRSTQQKLEELLALGAPFDSQQPSQLSGDASTFQFQCGAPLPCSAQISAVQGVNQLILASGGSPANSAVLALAGAARFVYRSSKTTDVVWPPSDPSRQSLLSIILLQTTAQGEAPLVEAKVWPEEPAQCAFDPVIADCR